VTELDDAVEGDTLFPTYDRAAWRLTHEARHDADDRHAWPFRFRTYVRVRPKV
jgi:dihydrofolate reductase